MAVRPNDATDIGAVLEADALPIDRVGSTAANKTTPGAIQTFVLNAATKALRCLRAIIGASIVDDGANQLQVSGSQINKAAGFAPPVAPQPLFGFKNVGNTATTSSIMSMCFNDTNVTGARILLGRNKLNGNRAGAGDNLGSINYGSLQTDGSGNLGLCASIQAASEDDIQTTGFLGARLSFHTGALGTTTMLERARINSSGQLLLGLTTSAFPLAMFQMAGKVYIKDTALTWPLAAYPSAGAILIAGATNQTTGIMSTCFNDTATQSPAITLMHNGAAGALPLAGYVLGRYSAGWTQTAGGSFGVGGMNVYAEVDIVQGVAHDCSLRFNTATGAGTSTERMRIKPAGTLNLSAVSVYADNAAALAGGLVAGDVYRTATGQLMIAF